ncbi:hypothetical protein SBA5_120029 [Candidatus Sulfotelmatomonas gaucii]|uniref:Uncharacterized protein n=1 Tax=Candidatus Sulfuritelmatomonas gaucii TaxID=2043161 RepID=A0A2N9L480_9BACT|nr:hypothetical protein SBA5_120029 [Candidatus Sulfotelmatomonas gaucii]
MQLFVIQKGVLSPILMHFCMFARCHARAYRWLKASVQQLSPSCMLLLVAPAFHQMRTDAQFQQLLRKTGHLSAPPQPLVAGLAQR